MTVFSSLPRLAIGMALCILFVPVRQVEGCSCARIDAPPPCELFGRTQVAFVGRILEAGSFGGDVRVRIDRPLNGVERGEITVRNDDAGVGCGYPFRQGRDYLVFAAKDDDGEIRILPCSRDIWDMSEPESEDAVKFVDAIQKPPTGGWIFGRVTIIEPASRVFLEEPQGVEGATVLLANGERVQRVRTGATGRFDFVDLPNGTYEVTVASKFWSGLGLPC